MSDKLQFVVFFFLAYLSSPAKRVGDLQQQTEGTSEQVISEAEARA
jgi:hypothetical protein